MSLLVVPLHKFQTIHINCKSVLQLRHCLVCLLVPAAKPNQCLAKIPIPLTFLQHFVSALTQLSIMADNLCWSPVKATGISRSVLIEEDRNVLHYILSYHMKFNLRHRSTLLCSLNRFTSRIAFAFARNTTDNQIYITKTPSK